MRDYYRRLFGTAFHHSYGRADALAGAIGIFGPVILRLLGFRDPDRIVGNLAWQIAFGVFATFFVARLIAAPYWMYQEDEAQRQKERAELEAKRAEEERKRAELEAKLTEELARREALLGDRQKRDERALCLVELLEEGKRLQEESIYNKIQMDLWIGKYREWLGKVDSDVGRKFSDADASRLKTIPIVIDRQRPTFDGSHQQAVARISAIMEGLHKMYDALPDD